MNIDEYLAQRGWSRDLLERCWREAGGDMERCVELLREYAPHESIDVLVREANRALKAAETNRVTKRRGKRGDVTSIATVAGNQVDYELRGQPAQKEEGVGEVLARLTHYLSAGEVGWTYRVRTPTAREEEGIDGDIFPPEGRGRPIPVQVTRPVPSTEYMQAAFLGANPSASDQPRELVDHLLHAAEEKRYLSGRHEIALALDAVSLVQVLLSQVVKAAQGEAAQFDAVGFRAVFLVGPADDLVHRLDSGPTLPDLPNPQPVPEKA